MKLFEMFGKPDRSLSKIDSINYITNVWRIVYEVKI